MKKLIESLKSISLKSILAVFLAGFLVVVTTACQPPAPRLSGEGNYKSRGPETELYKPVQEKQAGGMYPYKDTNEDTTRADIKARGLIDNAERNINKVDSPADYGRNYRQGTPLQDRIKNLSEDVGESAKGFGEDFAAGTERGMRNVKRNTANATENLKDSAGDATRQAKRSADNTADFLQDKAEDTKNSVKRAM